MVTRHRARTNQCDDCEHYAPPLHCTAKSRKTGQAKKRRLRGETDRFCSEFLRQIGEGETRPPEAISFGAGVNSVAMTIKLVSEGWTGPIIFADPGSEHPDTYCYITYFEREWLRKRGLQVWTISPLTHPELYTPSYRMFLMDKCEERNIVPLMMNRWCTTEYKRGPLTRFHKTEGIQTALIGIAEDESQRATRTVQDTVQIEYPLLDFTIDREECKEIIRAEGLVVPPKSGCWFCPFQEMKEWRMLYDLRPDLFNKAVELDEAAMDKMREVRANPYEGQLLWKFKMTLARVKLAWDQQMELPLMPAADYEHKMCECRL